MKNRISTLLILGLTVNAYAQSTIVDYMQIFDFKLENFNKGDISPTDTLVDLENGYFGIFAGDDESKITLCEGQIFENLDKSTLFLITGYSADEQCDWYTTYFYLKGKKENSFREINPFNILPVLSVNDFLENAPSIAILEKYLPQIKQEYLGEEATMDDVLNEIYSIRYFKSVEPTAVIARLHLCDYIFRNITGISDEDYQIIMQDIENAYYEFKYNSKKKIFEMTAIN
jgi:hypothetical protein